MIKAIKVMLLPNHVQTTKLFQYAGAARFAYNWALANGYNEQAEFMQCTIDRIDVNGNYEPSNCRWANARVQGDNTRTANRIEYNGEIHCLSDWARILNIGRKTLYYKLKKGLSFEQIVNESKNKKGG